MRIDDLPVVPGKIGEMWEGEWPGGDWEEGWRMGKLKLVDWYGRKRRWVDMTEYKGSEMWRAKARWIRRRDGGCCVRCGCCGPGTLDVHHLTYERVACEAPEDLETLCRLCHEEADAERREASARRLRGFGFKPIGRLYSDRREERMRQGGSEERERMAGGSRLGGGGGGGKAVCDDAE